MISLVSSGFMLMLLLWLSMFYYKLQLCFKVVCLSYSFFLYCLAVKAKAVGEIIKNRPPAGVLDAALAAEYKVHIFISELYQLLRFFHFCQNYMLHYNIIRSLRKEQSITTNYI